MKRKVVAVFFILLFLGTTISPCFYANPMECHEQLLESSDIVLENHDCYVFGVFDDISESQRPIYRGGSHRFKQSIFKNINEIFNQTLPIFLDYFINNDEPKIILRVIYEILFGISLITFYVPPLLGNIFPIAKGENVYFSKQIITFNWPEGNKYYKHYCRGNIWTNGTNGIVEYDGKIVGKLGIRVTPSLSMAMKTEQLTYLGAKNFTGFHTPKYMIGRCSHIKIGKEI